MYGYYISCQCQNDDGDEINVDIPVKFKDQDQYEILEGDGFDMLYEHFNKWLKTNGYDDYFVDDQPEQVKPIAEDKFPDNSLDLTNFKV